MSMSAAMKSGTSMTVIPDRVAEGISVTMALLPVQAIGVALMAVAIWAALRRR